MRIWRILFFVLLVASCASPRPPMPIPTPRPPAPVDRAIRVTVRGTHGAALPSATGALTPDTGAVALSTNTDGRLTFRTTATGGGWLAVDADGYAPKTSRIVLNENLDDVSLDPDVRVSRLHVEGRRFVTAEGEVWPWRGLTSFRLLHMIANGQRDEADAYLAWAAAHDVTVVRVLAMAWNLFRLAPADGVAALPTLLELATNHGIYVEVVALADTRSYTFNYEQHVQHIGAVCAVMVVCLVEMGNELDPLHGTQDGRLDDVAYVQALRRLIPSFVLVSLGSSHGGAADGSTKYAGGDFVTVHEDRSDGDDGWRWVRHRNDTRDLAERLGKPLVGDEPKRDDLSPDKHAGFALLAGMYELGDTFHYLGGLQTTIPAGAELAAFEGRRRGWLTVPHDWSGAYQNTGFAGSPVLNADWGTVLKVFSSVQTTTGFTVALGARGEPRLEWSPAWPSQSLLLAEGGIRLWRVMR